MTKRKKASSKLDRVYKLAVKNGSYFMGGGCKTKFCIKLTDLKKIIEAVKTPRRKND